jgi:hypothetical protein
MQALLQWLPQETCIADTQPRKTCIEAGSTFLLTLKTMQCAQSLCQALLMTQQR